MGELGYFEWIFVEMIEVELDAQSGAIGRQEVAILPNRLSEDEIGKRLSGALGELLDEYIRGGDI